ELSPRFPQAAEQVLEGAALLQTTQARSVRRRNVGGHIRRMLPDAAHAEHIVGRAIGAVFICTDSRADNSRLVVARRETISKRVEALVVETEAIDHGAIFAQPENPRARIALLRQRRDSPALDEREA